jgi:hypothetical protein
MYMLGWNGTVWASWQAGAKQSDTYYSSYRVAAAAAVVVLVVVTLVVL